MDNGKISSPLFPGRVALFGSGETSPSGRRVYDWLFSQMASPVRIAVLETPAGFQPNSAIVAGKVGEFLLHRLQNYLPQVSVVPARRKGAAQFSTDDANLITPVLSSDVIFLGPGSPTYAVRNLRDSLTWHTVVSCHRHGATLILASAATIAIGAYTIPVYEIYKSGEDLHWQPGLDFFRHYGLSLVFVSHWNNTEGGAELDTSRCYMGQVRFGKLLTMLPTDLTIVGIDEHTALIIDIPEATCRVMGRGAVTLLRNGHEQRYPRGHTFPIGELGPFHSVPPQEGIPSDVWQQVISAREKREGTLPASPTADVIELVQSREKAREQGDWSLADSLRRQILDHGWQVNDTPTGPQLLPGNNPE